MKRYGNLWEHVVDIDNVHLAYHEAVKGKSWRKEIQNFNLNFNDNIEKVQKLLIDREYTTSKYKVKTIYEPKERDIFVLPFSPDRIVQHALMNVIEPILDRRLYHHSYACRKGKGIHSGLAYSLRLTRGYRYCLKCDVSKFYPSINHDIMMDILIRIFKDEGVLWLLDDIVRSIDGETNIPIGNYTSQWLGNLFLDGLDKEVKDGLKVKAYVRYCDDFLLYSNDKEELQYDLDYIKEYLASERKLKLSKESIFPTKCGVDFLGYRVFPEKTLLRKSTAKRVKKRIKKLWDMYEKCDGDIMLLKHIYGSIESTFGWAKYAQTENFKQAIKLYELEDKVARALGKRHGNHYWEDSTKPTPNRYHRK